MYSNPFLATGRCNRRQWIVRAAGLAGASGLGLASTALAQRAATAKSVKPLANPRDFLLEIAPGPVRSGQNRRLLCRPTDNGPQIVARLLVEVGDTRIVTLPNGRLIAVSESQSTLTDKPFNPATMLEVAAELKAKQFSGFKTRNTNRYLYLYNTSDEFYTAASRIMETMFPGVYGYARARKPPVHPPEFPMVVLMFRTEQEYLEYQNVPGAAAYYSSLSNSVVMYEQSRLNRLAPELAIRQSISVIAHEGAHQILHNIGVQQRLSTWPMWISEGLAEYFAPTSTGQRLRWKGAGQLNELRLIELDRYLRRRRRNARGDLVEHTVEAAQLTSTGYATAWALTHFLAQRQPKKFFGYLQEVSRIGPLEGATRSNQGRIAENRELFAKHFGNDMDGLEAQVVDHLRKLLTG